MTGRAKGCEGICEGFAKGSAKALTCESKGSKGFFLPHAHKEKEKARPHYATPVAQNPFDPFAPQVNPFAHAFAEPFATPSHAFGTGP